MKNIQFRTLASSEIQVRPTDTKYKGKATLLLYQDARVGMDILDETVGNTNWSKEYYEVAGNVFCKVGIRDEETGEWTYKADCGSESNVDAEKGQASDAFKRAVVNWGIGRELYSTPKIKIDCPDSYYWNDKMTMTFSVKEIKWNDNKELISLIILDKFGKEVYNISEEPEKKEELFGGNPPSNQEILTSFCTSKKKEEGVNLDELKKFYQFYSSRTETWKGIINPGILWNKWLTTQK